MTQHPEARTFLLPTPVRGTARHLAVLAGAALLALSTQCLANSRELLGAGDTIRITVFQNPDLTTETRVSERGTIVFPLRRGRPWRTEPAALRPGSPST